MTCKYLSRLCIAWILIFYWSTAFSKTSIRKAPTIPKAAKEFTINVGTGSLSLDFSPNFASIKDNALLASTFLSALKSNVTIMSWHQGLLRLGPFNREKIRSY